MGSTCGTDAGKSALRAEYLRVRERVDAVAATELDSRIHARLASLDLFAEAGLVLLQVSQGGEVDTRHVAEVLWSEGRRVAAACCGACGNLGFREVWSWDDLREGDDGRMVPGKGAGHVLEAPELVGSVCLVPGLVFDAEGYRVGNDDGAYDRFLPFYPGDKLAMARSMELSSNPLPHEAAEVPVDVIVTDQFVWHCR